MINSITQPATNPINVSEALEQQKVHLRDQLGKIVASTVQELCRDSEDRKKSWKTDIKKLDAGVWSPNTYYNVLKEANQTNRIEWFIKNNSFYHTHPPKDAFVHIPDRNPNSKTGVLLAKLVLKNGVKASEALKAVKTKLCLLDCAQICQIGQYQALYEILGQAKFDKLFSHDSGEPLVLSDYAFASNPLLPFLVRKTCLKGELLQGQRVAFANDPRYCEKHLMGETAGINVIVLEGKKENPLFVGQELPSDGATPEQVEQYLIEEYNAPPIGLEIVSDALAEKIWPRGGKEGYRSQELKKVKECSVFLTSETAKKPFGLLNEEIFDFNIALIKELVESPLSNISFDKVVKLWEKTQIEQLLSEKAQCAQAPISRKKK